MNKLISVIVVICFASSLLLAVNAIYVGFIHTPDKVESIKSFFLLQQALLAFVPFTIGTFLLLRKKKT